MTLLQYKTSVQYLGSWLSFSHLSEHKIKMAAFLNQFDSKSYQAVAVPLLISSCLEYMLGDGKHILLTDKHRAQEQLQGDKF